MSRLLCVGVLGASNAPLFLKTFVSASETEAAGGPDAFLRVMHCALDVVEARLAETTIKTAAGGGAHGAVAGAGRGPKDPFLGMVFATEDHRVYAHVTNTGARFLLVYDDARAPAEADVRAAFARLHDAYADAASDPFADPERKIENRAFAERVASIAGAGGVGRESPRA